MKTLMSIIAMLFLWANITQAQDTLRTQSKDKNRSQMRDRVHREDHVMMMDGKFRCVRATAMRFKVR